MTEGSSGPRVIVVGGGFTGLVTAYHLSRGGARVALHEAGSELGGIAGVFPFGGAWVEKFYHHVLGSDHELFQLLRDLQAEDLLGWHPGGVGYFTGGRLYRWGGPLDLLRFRPLSLGDKIRFGRSLLRIAKVEDWQLLDDLPAVDWLRRLSGERVTEAVWVPLLKGKWGDHYPEIPATWVWRRVKQRVESRDSAAGGERLGYIRGSTRSLADLLRRRIEEAGGQVVTGSRVQEVLTAGARLRGVFVAGQVLPCDAVVLTQALPLVRDLVPGLPEDYRRRLEETPYLAVIQFALELDRRLSPVYWLNIDDGRIPFVGAIEHTNFIGPEEYGGRHLVYLANYHRRDDPQLELSEEELFRKYFEGLRVIHPRLEAEWIRQRHLFREECAHSVRTLGYHRRKLDYATPVPGVFLATDALVYPQDRGLTVAARLGQEVAGRVLALGEQARSAGGAESAG